MRNAKCQVSSVQFMSYIVKPAQKVNNRLFTLQATKVTVKDSDTLECN